MSLKEKLRRAISLDRVNDMRRGKWYLFTAKSGARFRARYEGFEDGAYQFLEGLFTRRAIPDLSRYEIVPA